MKKPGNCFSFNFILPLETVQADADQGSCNLLMNSLSNWDSAPSQVGMNILWIGVSLILLSSQELFIHQNTEILCDCTARPTLFLSTAGVLWHALKLLHHFFPLCWGHDLCAQFLDFIWWSVLFWRLQFWWWAGCVFHFFWPWIFWLEFFFRKQYQWGQ